MENLDPDYNNAVEIAKDIWWVGHYLPDDPLFPLILSGILSVTTRIRI
ncbi:MAG: hypothetical protein PF693_18240 [Spirochaetia bacterium]|jgi:hypothetical protein|nr:hypothetical protein [Spirochaetia bacterium]